MRRNIPRKARRLTTGLNRAVHNIAEGHYVIPMDPKGVKYNIRKLDKYCRARGIHPSKLTAEELKQFEVKPKNMFII